MTSVAVIIVLSASMNILGVGRYLTANGLDLTQLLIFSAIIGFTGSIISLLISKWMAKRSTGARVIDPQAPANAREAWLLDRKSVGKGKSVSVRVDLGGRGKLTKKKKYL